MFVSLSVIFAVGALFFGGGWAFGANPEFASRAMIIALICFAASILCGYASHKKDEF